MQTCGITLTLAYIVMRHLDTNNFYFIFFYFSDFTLLFFYFLLKDDEEGTGQESHMTGHMM